MRKQIIMWFRHLFYPSKRKAENAICAEWARQRNAQIKMEDDLIWKLLNE